MSFLMILMSCFVTLFLMLKHPLTLVVLLMLFTMLILTTTMSMLNMSWLMMILFMVFLGGLLIIFTYLSALIPNEIYFFSAQWLLILMSPSISSWLMEVVPESPQLMLISTTLNKNENSSIHMFMVYLLTTLMTTMVMSQSMKSPLNQTNY